MLVCLLDPRVIVAVQVEVADSSFIDEVNVGLVLAGKDCYNLGWRFLIVDEALVLCVLCVLEKPIALVLDSAGVVLVYSLLIDTLNLWACDGFGTIWREHCHGQCRQHFEIHSLEM